MIADLVTAHPDVIPTDELTGATLRGILDAVERLEATLGARPERAWHWKTIRQDYFLNCIANTYTRQSRGDETRFCNKTPRLEESYAAISACCPTHKPLFVYCARHPRKVVASLLRMPWYEGSAKGTVTMLHQSAVTLGDMRRDPSVDVFVAQLDQVPPTGAAHDEFANSLFDFLQLDMAQEVGDYVSRWPVAQPAGEVLGASAHDTLGPRELARLRRSRPYRELCASLGYDPAE